MEWDDEKDIAEEVVRSSLSLPEECLLEAWKADNASFTIRVSHHGKMTLFVTGYRNMGKAKYAAEAGAYMYVQCSKPKGFEKINEVLLPRMRAHWRSGKYTVGA